MEKEHPQKGGDRYTIGSLRLNLQAAIDGKTWLLLPEGYRDQDSGKSYPLPSRRHELQKLAAIYLPPHHEKQDSGCIYIRRALAKWKKRQQSANSAILDTNRRVHAIAREHSDYKSKLKGLRQEAKQAVEDVRREAAIAVSSLNDLFVIGRKGIDGQMRAHLSGKEWKGEKITARDFRDCFRMVTQAVKNLGLPSDQTKHAQEAVTEELAASIRSMQETMSLVPSTDTEN